MNFYTLDYIISHQSADSVLRVGMMLALLLAGIVFTVLYLRDRIRTRWRDAGVAAIVLLLVLVGVQTEQYFQVSNRAAAQRMSKGSIRACNDSCETDRVCRSCCYFARGSMRSRSLANSSL